VPRPLTSPSPRQRRHVTVHARWLTAAPLNLATGERMQLASGVWIVRRPQWTSVTIVDRGDEPPGSGGPRLVNLGPQLIEEATV